MTHFLSSESTNSLFKDKVNALLALKLKTELEQNEKHKKDVKDVLCRIGTILFRQTRYAESVSYLERYVKEIEENGSSELGEQCKSMVGPAWRMIGSAYYRMWLQEEENEREENRVSIKNNEELHRSYAAFQKALRSIQNATNPEVLFEVANVYIGHGVFDGALKLLGRIIDVFPTYQHLGNVVLTSAVVLSQIQRFRESFVYFQKALQHPPAPYEDADVLVLAARTYERSGNANLALGAYRRVHGMEKSANAFQKWVGNPNTWLAFAKRFYRLREYLGSLDCMRRGFELATLEGIADEGGNGNGIAYADMWAGFDGYYFFAKLLARAGQSEEASESLRRAIDYSMYASEQAAYQAIYVAATVDSLAFESALQVVHVAAAQAAEVGNCAARYASRTSKKNSIDVEDTVRRLRERLEAERREKELAVALCTAAKISGFAATSAAMAKDAAREACDEYKMLAATHIALVASQRAIIDAQLTVGSAVERLMSANRQRECNNVAARLALRAASDASRAHFEAIEVIRIAKESRNEASAAASALALQATRDAKRSIYTCDACIEEYADFFERQAEAIAYAAHCAYKASFYASESLRDARRRICRSASAQAAEIAKRAAESAMRQRAEAENEFRVASDLIAALTRAVKVARKASMTAFSVYMRLDDALSTGLIYSSGLRDVVRDGGKVGVASFVTVNDFEEDVHIARRIESVDTETEPIVSVQLRECETGPKTMRVLCDILGRPTCALRRLEMSNTNLSLTCLQTLMQSASDSVSGLALAEFVLTNQPRFGDEGAVLLCRGLGDFFVSRWGRLQELSLSLCSVGSVGATQLAEAIRRCRGLTSLDISHNPDIGDVATSKIVTALSSRRVRHVEGPCAPFRRLNLCFVDAGDATARAVANFLSSSSGRGETSTRSLELLDLRGNRVTCTGAVAIASQLQRQSAMGSKLFVKLDSNAIGSRGAISLLKVLRWRACAKTLVVTMRENPIPNSMVSSFEAITGRAREEMPRVARSNQQQDDGVRTVSGEVNISGVLPRLVPRRSGK